MHLILSTKTYINFGTSSPHTDSSPHTEQYI